MWKLQLKGYDSLIIGKELELPDIFTLAVQPMFINVDFAEAYEKCNSEIVRGLLDRVPLKGGYKHTMVTSIVQFMSPRTSSIQNAEWHLDPGVPAPHKHDARLHILSSGYDLTSTTKFIKNGIDVDMPDDMYEARHRVLRKYLTDNAESLGFEEVAVQPNRFVTFTNLHPHIALPPKKYELRYFFRVQESDVEPAREFRIQDQSSVLLDKSENSELIPTFKQWETGIFLRTKI